MSTLVPFAFRMMHFECYLVKKESFVIAFRLRIGLSAAGRKANGLMTQPADGLCDEQILNGVWVSLRPQRRQHDR